MKKATIIFFTLMLIFLAACQKNEQQEITTKNSDIHTETAAETSETTTEIPSTENALSDSVQPASTSNIKEVSPYNVVDLDIHKMKAALKAAETMSDEDFENYLISNYSYAHNCRIGVAVSSGKGYNAQGNQPQYLELRAHAVQQSASLAVCEHCHSHIISSKER